MGLYPMYKGKETCERCHKPVEPEKAVWLELSADTGIYHDGGQLPKGEESQGGFAFGPDCAAAVRKNREGWKPIGLAKRNGE